MKLCCVFLTVVCSSIAYDFNATEVPVIVNTTSEISSTSIVLINSTTTISVENRPSKLSLKSHWWIILVVLVTVILAVSIGIIHYYRRKSPYRRFLRNWRSRDDDRDNIILQLEQPEIINGQWPPRISFN